MEQNTIETRLVQGFMDSGKTTFIQDCILNDYFHKYGSTLILCFEQGESEYDIAALRERRTEVAFFGDEEEENVTAFCLRMINEHHPDRIYVEMNAMMQGLREALPPVMNITYISVWVEWKTMDLYVRNLQQLLNQMVSEAHQVTFRGCPSKDLLAPYSQLFRLMNHKATYLRQDPMGYHEKAFDLFVPWSLDENEIEITQETYLLFWLDAADHPEHYDGKMIRFTSPLEVRVSGNGIGSGSGIQSTDRSAASGDRQNAGKDYSAGRIVMTCCMADLQFMSFPLAGENVCPDTGWFLITARAECRSGEYGRRVLSLQPCDMQTASAPAELILSAQV